jgi:hypothetical protein
LSPAVSSAHRDGLGKPAHLLQNYSSFLELVKSSDLVRLTVSWHARLMWAHGKKIRGFFWVCLAGRRTLSHARRKERRRRFVQVDGAILLSN